MAPEVKTALRNFQINTCHTLSGSGAEAVRELLAMIHGQAKLIEMGFRKEANGESLLDNANPELVASALGGLGYLAALATLHADGL